MGSTGAVVARFAKALTTALYDVDLESTRKVYFFYDADSIVPVILGFRQLGRSSYRRSERELLVRSLLSSGYLGKAHVLRPHALELDEVFRAEATYQSSPGRDQFREDLTAFLQEWGVYGDLADLVAAMRAETDDNVRIERFVARLQELGAHAFIAIELANGAWQQRFRRLFRNTLVLERVEVDFAETLASDAFRRVNEALNSARRPRAGIALNNVRDAAALALLSERIRRSLQDQSAPLVRFYTETSALHRLLVGESELRTLLAYPDATIRESIYAKDCTAILRDADYLSVRAAFGALAFAGMSSVSVGDSMVSISELRGVARQLDMVLSSRPTTTWEEALSVIRLGDRALETVVADFENLSFIQAVWRNYPPPPALKDALVDLPIVWDFIKGKADIIDAYVRKELTTLFKRLDDTLTNARAWAQDLKTILKAAEHLNHRLQEYDRPDVMRDLGLIRWGVILSEEEKIDLNANVDALLSGDEARITTVASELAYTCKECKTAEQCRVSSAVLWLLGLHDMIVRVTDAFAAGRSGDIPGDLILVGAAARSRGATPLRTAEKAAILERLRQMEGTLESGRRGSYLVGVGYVAFNFWLSEQTDSRAVLESEHREPTLREEWVRLSLESGERAIDLLRDDPLGRAFALNHCVYVGCVSKIVPDRTRVHIRALNELRKYTDVWHYRFADTLAYDTYLTALRRWEHSRRLGLEVTGRLRADVCEMLQSARRSLSEASPDFGDPEIAIHRKEIELLEREVVCSASLIDRASRT